MGSLVSLLVLGAIYTITYVVKNLGGKEDGRSFGESFPTIEVLEPELPEATAVQQHPVVERHVAPAKSRTRVNEPSLRVVAPAIQEEKQGKRERLVKIGNKSEAKRAFLYSEIFNRKY